MSDGTGLAGGNSLAEMPRLDRLVSGEFVPSLVRAVGFNQSVNKWISQLLDARG